MKQTSFLPKIDPRHGGDHRKGLRKIARPVDPRRPLHITMRSARARGALSMLEPKNKRQVQKTVDVTAKKTGVKIFRFVNVGNHLHFLVQTPSKKALQAFLRELAGRIAMRITGAAKGRGQKFWDGLAFTRIVNWGRDFHGVVVYLVQNLFEATGLLTQTAKRAGARAMKVPSD